MSSDGHEIYIRRLEQTDDRSTFTSGNIDLDRFFQRFAGQNPFRHHIGITYVATSGDDITGFVTVSSGQVVTDTLPARLRKKLPAYPLPVLRIARLAVDKHFQGLGIGRLLLRAILELSLEMRDRTGCIGIVVDAKTEAVGFYSKLGFERLDTISGSLPDHPEPVAMFLSVRLIEAAMPPEG